jgi:hypothetical protein
MKKLIAVTIVVVVAGLATTIYILYQKKTLQPFESAKDSIEFVAEMYNQQKLFYAMYGSYTSDVKFLMDQAYIPIDAVSLKFGFVKPYEQTTSIEDLPFGHDSARFNSDHIRGLTYTEDVANIDFLAAAAKNCPEAFVTEKTFTLCVIVSLNDNDNIYGVITINNEQKITKKILEAF